MTFEPYHRKVALHGLGISGRDIARALEVNYSLVSHVLAGRRWMGVDARRVMEHIAGLFGAPISQVFPGCERRRGWRRTTIAA